MQREQFEWANIWWDNANDNTLPRLLLIGDSISVGYRTGVQALFKDRYAVDLLATSKSIDDPAFIKEVDYMLSQYPYEAVHFNNGIHGLHLDLYTYKLSYQFTLNFIKNKCANIIVATSTPATNMDDHTKYSSENVIILKRNDVAVALAEQNELPINDLYAAMDGKAAYKRDSYHYHEDGIEEQAGLVYKSLTNVLSSETVWEGFQTTKLYFDGDEVIIAKPKVAAKGCPWVWRTEFFGAFPSADIEMLQRGWHVVGLCIPDLFGAPIATEKMAKFQEFITDKFNLAPKAVLFGFSRGGLYAINYAAGYPKKVSALYLDAPVVDVKSWPAGEGNGTGSEYDWDLCKRAYGLSEADAFTATMAQSIEDLKANRIPVVIVAGDKDEVVPFEENGQLIAKAYQNTDIPFKLILKPGVGHHPHSLENPNEIVDFILNACKGRSK